jgi:hypothetical protein
VKEEKTKANAWAILPIVKIVLRPNAAVTAHGAAAVFPGTKKAFLPAPLAVEKMKTIWRKNVLLEQFPVRI